MDYKNKYLKYKLKYLNAKKLYKGGSVNNEIEVHYYDPNIVLDNVLIQPISKIKFNTYKTICSATECNGDHIRGIAELNTQWKKIISETEQLQLGTLVESYTHGNSIDFFNKNTKKITFKPETYKYLEDISEKLNLKLILLGPSEVLSPFALHLLSTVGLSPDRFLKIIDVVKQKKSIEEGKIISEELTNTEAISSAAAVARSSAVANCIKETLKPPYKFDEKSVEDMCENRVEEEEKRVVALAEAVVKDVKKKLEEAKKATNDTKKLKNITTLLGATSAEDLLNNFSSIIVESFMLFLSTEDWSIQKNQAMLLDTFFDEVNKETLFPGSGSEFKEVWGIKKSCIGLILETDSISERTDMPGSYRLDLDKAVKELKCRVTVFEICLIYNLIKEFNKKFFVFSTPLKSENDSNNKSMIFIVNKAIYKSVQTIS